MTSSNRVYLFDTTLRDGAQTQGVDFTVADKAAIARELDRLGIDYIEGGWPGANPTDDRFFAEDELETRADGNKYSVETGTPVMEETTSAMAASSTVTTLASIRLCHASSSSTRRARSSFSRSRRRPDSIWPASARAPALLASPGAGPWPPWRTGWRPAGTMASGSC